MAADSFRKNFIINRMEPISHQAPFWIRNFLNKKFGFLSRQGVCGEAALLDA
jgi:hypothetical protein